MRESDAFHPGRARVSTFTAVGLSLVLSIASCVGVEDPPDGAGVAVTVQLENGGTVPGIFRGSRDEASENSGGRFHFEEGAENVDVLRPGAAWVVDDDSVEPTRPGLAIIVHREDGSVVPGEFRGPSRLAEVVSEVWATGRGATEPPPANVLELPERHARVGVIPPGTAVRAIAPS